jgi:photosystem II stability/assembly factor-like uncharacterized protein
MKAIIRIVSVMVILACSFAGMAQQADVVIDSPPSYTTGSLDYWYGKINAPDFSYRQFRNEFDGYWSNREKVKGSGYKQVARWLIHQEAYLNPDGSMRNPVEDIEDALTYTQMYANQTISGTWTYAGPDQTVGGRTTAIAFSPHNPQKVFVGAPLGGLWGSDNGGASYYCMNTDNISALGVSAIAVHPNDPNIIYIGTGDRDSHKTTGIGIYKSVDGGLTWIPKPISAIHDKVVHKIYIHPGNPDIMTIESNYGVYTTLNGGDTWTQKLVVNLKDAEQKPGDPYTIYAASGSGFYKSTDFGATWELKLSGIAHRIALGVTAANPQKVVMFTSLNSAFHHLYVSNNSGESFTLVNSTGIVDERQGGYNLDVIIDPLNENIMYAGMVNFYKSVNGGVTWVEQTPVYADDQHTFEFHPVTHRLFIGNDSGIWITDNGTSYNRSSNGLNISEPYRIDVAAQNPNHWIIGSQDASTFVTNGGPFYNSIGADGMTCRFDPTDANYVYGSSQYGFIARSTNGGLANSSFTGIAGENINGINQKGNFQTSFHLDYFNQNRMFAGMKDLWRSTNVKTADASNITWTNISNGAFGTVSTIEFIEQSKVNANIIYVFDDHQRIFRSDNALATTPVWTQLSNPGMNHGVRFTTHPTQENTIYMVSGNYIYKSVDKGDTWVNLTANLQP